MLDIQLTCGPGYQPRTSMIQTGLETECPSLAGISRYWSLRRNAPDWEWDIRGQSDIHTC